MADFTDVASALRDLIAAAIYPNGTGQSSALGFGVQVYQGWPTPEKLDADLKQGMAHVSIWPTPQEKPSADHFADWQTLSIQATTLTLTVSGQTVTVGGTVSTPQNVGIVADGLAYAYAVQASDTLTTIATALASGLAGQGIGASNTGAVITLASAKKIAGRTGSQGVSMRELRRQERVFQVSCWANTPATRDALAKLVDTTMGATWRLSMTDGTSVNLFYRGSSQHDESQKQLIYRRDLMYGGEYATTQTRTDAQVLIDTMTSAGAAVIAAGVPTITTNF